MELEAVGLCIRRNREAKGFSLSQLAQMTGMDPEVMQAYEHGKQKPSAKELKQISKALDVPMAALLHGGGDIRILRRDKNGKAVCERRSY